MSDWFVSWFNSHYYHLLYRDRNFAEAERFIEHLLAYLDLPKGSKVLDLACGKGRHSVQLHNAGFDVIGIDLSEESISQAKTMETDGLEFFEHDMRSLYWDNYFDLVVNLFTSFGYFHNSEDDLKTICSVADALKPNGLFVLDFLNAVKVQNTLVAFEERVIEGVTFELNRSVTDGMIVKRIHVIDPLEDVELDFEEQVDALRLDDFQTYFENAGLELMSAFGNYDLAPFDEKTSDRLIMITRKTAV
ncbi:MAG: hypothetical protein RL266_521 [Bacteroidota bacterium]